MTSYKQEHIPIQNTLIEYEQQMFEFKTADWYKQQLLQFKTQ